MSRRASDAFAMSLALVPFVAVRPGYVKTGKVLADFFRFFFLRRIPLQQPSKHEGASAKNQHHEHLTQTKGAPSIPVSSKTIDNGSKTSAAICSNLPI